MRLKKGARLDVALEGNPTTGSTWVLVQGDSNIVRAQGTPQFLPGSDQVGAPGTQTLHFEIVGKGKTPLRLEYRRPLEPNLPAEKTFTLDVVAD